MKTARVGDKIQCMGITVTIGSIYYSDCWDGVWDIEFKDTDGNYRHWKQYYDGGEYIPQETEQEPEQEPEPETATEYYRDFYGCVATIEKYQYCCVLTIKTGNGDIIHKKTYQTHKGARIAMGKLSDCWHFIKASGRVKIKL